MQNEKVIKIYTKFCIDCIRSEEMKILLPYCRENGFDVEIVRTSYRPKLHDEASRLWGGEDYTMFLVYGGERIDFDYAIEQIRKGIGIFKTEKKANVTKKKPTNKGKAK